MSATDATAPLSTSPAVWRAVVQGLSGASRVRRVLPAEVAAVQAWLAQLELDLTHPATSADVSLLGSIGRCAILETRLARIVFERGAFKRGGEVRPAIGELRAIIRLKSDLLARLEFRREPRKLVDLRDAWRDTSTRTEAAGATNGDSAPSVPTRGADRAAAPATASERAALDVGGGVFNAPAPGVAAARLSISAGGVSPGIGTSEANGPLPGDGRRGGDGSGVEPSPATSAAPQSPPGPFDSQAARKQAGDHRWPT